MQAREKMKGRAPEACSSSDARGACDDASMTMEEGHTDKRDAGDEAAVLHRTKGLSLSALVSEVQKLTSLMVKVSLSSCHDTSQAFRVDAPVVGTFDLGRVPSTPDGLPWLHVPDQLPTEQRGMKSAIVPAD